MLVSSSSMDLTLNLTAVGGSAHTLFKGPLLKKSLSAKKIGKKYLFHGKLLLNLSLGLCSFKKTSISACFRPQNRPKS
jgi:hypothetical protein